MKIPFACSLIAEIGQRNVEETCCLQVLGELTLEESERWETHLIQCESCRKLAEEYEQIMLFDLPAIAVARMDGTTPASPPEAAQVQLLANVRARAAAIQARAQDRIQEDNAQTHGLHVLDPRPRSSLRSLTRPAGWALAAGLLFGLSLTMAKRSNSRPHADLAPMVAQAKPAVVEKATLLENQFAAAEQRANELAARLAQAEAKAKNAELAYERSRAQAQNLAIANTDLEARAAEDRDRLTQRNAELELTRKSLNDEIAFKDALRSNLTDTYDRLEKEKSEVARLQRASLTTPVHFSSPDRSLGEAEAKEILGARDLHHRRCL